MNNKYFKTIGAPGKNKTAVRFHFNPVEKGYHQENRDKFWQGNEKETVVHWRWYYHMVHLYCA